MRMGASRHTAGGVWTGRPRRPSSARLAVRLLPHRGPLSGERVRSSSQPSVAQTGAADMHSSSSLQTQRQTQRQVPDAPHHLAAASHTHGRSFPSLSTLLLPLPHGRVSAAARSRLNLGAISAVSRRWTTAPSSPLTPSPPSCTSASTEPAQRQPREAAERQPRYSRGTATAEVQPRYSRGTAKVQPRCSQGAAEMVP